MQENNFERQVQQKTSELKISPSEDVWQKVLVAITKRKSNRRAIAILCLLLIFIGSGFFIIFDHGAERISNRRVSQNHTLPKKATIEQQVIIAPKPIQNEIEVAKKAPGVVKTAKSAIVNDAAVLNVNKQEKNVKSSSKLKTGILTAGIESKDENNNAASDPGSFTEKSKKDKFKTKAKTQATIINRDLSGAAEGVTSVEDVLTTEKSQSIVIKDAGTKKDDLTNPVSNDQTVIDKPIKDTTTITASPGKEVSTINKPAQSTPTSKRASKWKIGFNFSVGIAATKNGYLGAIGLSNDDKSAVNSYPNQSTGGTGQGGYNYPVSTATNAGTGIVLGAFLQKDISAKINFLVGVNYKELTTGMRIGNRIDSASSNSFFNLSSYYTNGVQNRYKNHFYFLELPLALQINLNKPHRRPLYLNTGIAISRLISSDALQFDVQQGIYYNKNSMFDKTQVSLSLGLLFALSRQLQNPFLVGPDINFSLSKMAATGIYDNRHYSYFGLHFQKSIGKK